MGYPTMTQVLTHVHYECLEKVVCLAHILHNESKVVLGSSHQVRTDRDRQVLNRHVILFFVVRNPVAWQ